MCIRDRGQINAQRVIQCNHVLLEEDLDELHQNSNDQNERLSQLLSSLLFFILLDFTY